ncbi:MAG: glutathione S-transferase family protein [Paracoccaceae bacterium]|nr:glutathione S-transferase family protein [Paracoccaceae bacterium]
MSEDLVLMSHHLCPYVQRAAIAMHEKGMQFDRIQIDLSAKPDWFMALSPLGKTPVLTVAGKPIFESSVILEYLEDTGPTPLHPTDPFLRAQHRAWMEFGSAVLNDIAGFYSGRTKEAFDEKTAALHRKFGRIETELGTGPYFNGKEFSLVDAVFGPIFRYFDTFDRIDDFHILTDMPKLTEWRQNLSRRPSVRMAVTTDYHARLVAFVRARGSYLSGIMEKNDRVMAG